MKNQSHKKKILIGVDGNEANIDQPVGVNMYAFETLKAIYELQDEWNDRYEFQIYLSTAPRGDMPAEREGFRYNVLEGSGLWVIRTLLPSLYRDSHKPDFFWTPSHYVPPFAPMPRICSIMDIGYLRFSGQFTRRDFWQLKLWTAWSILVSKRVIAISEATKKDIVRHYPFAHNKITTTLLGYDNKIYHRKISAADVRRVKDHYKIENYVLFMSTLKPSKNIEGLLRAWSTVSQKHTKTKLVIAGKKGWMYENIFKLVTELGITDQVIFTDYISEETKPGLICGAKAFILPSFWEGFGIDVVTAMACGVPVVVSDRASLPEVAGEAGIIVNPDSVESISNGIDTILSAPKNVYDAMVEKGIKRAQSFSWTKTARETLSVFDSLIR